MNMEIPSPEQFAARSLQSMGYLNVQSIAGGIEAWVQAGLPIVVPKQPSFD